ncbi:MAG: MATE family efflux transporter [Lachnospiraceae bacterium]
MTNKADTRTMLLTASPLKLMISLSLPAILGMVVVGLYNLADAIYVGQMVGSTAMGAVSVAYPFTLVNSGIATLIGVGSASVLSRAVGKKDQETIDKIMGNLITLNVILGIIVTAVGMIFTRQILTLTGAEGEILEHAVRYLRIIFAGSLFVNFSQSSNMVMRGEGILKKAMLITGTGAVLNIILDPIFIMLLNSSGKGIEGAAYATILSQFITALITIWYFIKKSKMVKIHKIRLEKALLPEILGVGFSAMLMQVMTLVQQTVLYYVAAQNGGDTWQILLGAALRVQSFAFIPLWGMSQGFQPAAGTNYGAKEYERVKKVTLGFSLGATVLAVLFYLPVELAPKTILSWFITDAAIVNQGISDFRVMFSTYIVLGFLITVITLFQALGKASKASILVVLRQIALFIPLAIILPKIGNLGIHGVFLAPALTDGIIFIIGIFLVIAEFRSLTKLQNGGE